MVPPRPSRRASLSQRVLWLVEDAGAHRRGLTLNEIQTYLEDYEELGALSACMVRLVRLGRVRAEFTERTTARGRRQVKCYRLEAPREGG
ncbi:hypothetical protein VI26_04715 [Chromobacterium sp. LK1]|nr:hypothetical protein VI26_04715 [Chromobacterium sp. LK1]